MGSTPNYSLPYPAETDDADVPVDMQELAAAIDGVMLGKTRYVAKGDLLAGDGAGDAARVTVGTNGQILSADNTQTSGLKWIPLAGAYVPVTDKGQPNGVASLDSGGKVPVAQLPASSAIPATIVDAKGDIIAATAPDAVARVAVGADGQVLAADSTQAAGVKWVPPVAGGAGIPPTLLDAKGDLIAASANDTAARLGVGTDGQVLTADAAQALGLRWATPATPSTVIAIGTTLPASPTDGQEAILVDSLTLPTYQWRFRYTASITDAYKWVYLGGTPILNEVVTTESTASNTYANLGTVGPSVTVPRAGVYAVEIGCIGQPGAAATGYMSFDIGATAAVDADAAVIAVTSSVNNPWRGQRWREATMAAAATALTAKYHTTGGVGFTFSYRFMRVTPKRVS